MHMVTLELIKHLAQTTQGKQSHRLMNTLDRASKQRAWRKGDRKIYKMFSPTGERRIMVRKVRGINSVPVRNSLFRRVHEDIGAGCL